MTDLERVLIWLDDRSTSALGLEPRLYKDAARLLREMARDFDKYAAHDLDDDGRPCEDGCGIDPCSCGMDAARERWRLT